MSLMTLSAVGYLQYVYLNVLPATFLVSLWFQVVTEDRRVPTVAAGDHEGPASNSPGRKGQYPIR